MFKGTFQKKIQCSLSCQHVNIQVIKLNFRTFNTKMYMITGDIFN
jgi:hypothetical protein